MVVLGRSMYRIRNVNSGIALRDLWRYAQLLQHYGSGYRCFYSYAAAMRVLRSVYTVGQECFDEVEVVQ